MKKILIILGVLLLVSGCSSYTEENKAAQKCIDKFEGGRGYQYTCTYGKVDNDMFGAKITCELDESKREQNHKYLYNKYMVGVKKDGAYVLTGIYNLNGTEKTLILNPDCKK